MIQTEYFGIGTIKKLEEVLAKEKPHKIFLVTGKSSYTSSGAAEKLSPILQPYHYIHFSDFSPNPKIEDIEKGMELYRKENCDFTIAVGGGSVMDVAKAITILSAQSEAPAIYIRGEKKAENKGKPLVAIPTTSGSGSEATSFAVVYINKSKYSLYHPQFMLPDYAIIDPELTFTCSPHLTACSGMDALAQAIESYWSTNANTISQMYSKEAIQLTLANLEKAVNSASSTKHPNPEARTNMSKAANLAGKAINITATTACHAISYPFTSYFNVPHGHAVALTLGEMVVHNANVQKEDCLDGRGLFYVQNVMKEISRAFGLLPEISPAEKVRARVNLLMDKIGLERSLTKLGVKSEEDMQLILSNVNLERLKNNPRRLTNSELKKILERLR